MKKYLKILVVIGVLGFVGYAWAQSTPNTYNCRTTSVTSATVPTAIMTPGRITTWSIHTRSGAAVSALVFPFMGATAPTAVPTPTAVMEVPVGATWSDAITCNAPTCNDAIGQGWAAVLSSGSTAITIDACGR